MQYVRNYRLWVSAAVALGLSVVGWWAFQPSRAEIIRRAESFLDRGEPQETLRLLTRVLHTLPVDGDAEFCAAQACIRMRRFADAADHYLKVPPYSALRAEACFRAGDLFLLRLFDLSRAEMYLLETLRLNPRHFNAQGHLAGLYGLCGFTGQTTELRFRRLRANRFSDVDLSILALGDTAAEMALPLADFVRTNSDDPLVLVARGNYAWQHNDLVAARQYYEAALARRLDLYDAHARLGRILCELNDEAAFLHWFSNLPSAAKQTPECWAVFGDWCLNQHDSPGAIRCFWETTRLDPTHRRAHFRLGQALAGEGYRQLAEPFQRRNEYLQEYLLAAKRYTSDPSLTCALRCIEVLQDCHQSWETWGWSEFVRQRFPQSSNRVNNIRQPPANTPRVETAGQPALDVDLSGHRLPKWMALSTSRPKTPGGHLSSGDAAIHFTDDASRTGLRFQFVNGDDLPGAGMRMFQFTGGGVGVLDYDRDGWPDLYFTQGGKWPDRESKPPPDLLFRNRLGTAFEDITSPAGIRELDYSQGIAVADFDCDGWEDIFIANVASNRLFHNNGDGTFSDVSDAAAVGDNEWTTSAVGADFNGDGLPDLYAVNYLTGPRLHDRFCKSSSGKPRTCTPHEFEAAEDQLLMNLGSGAFQDVSRESNVHTPGGKGLGIVAADFDGTGKLSVFVANDTTANFFFQNQTAEAGAIPAFQEMGVIVGLAFDSEGRTQACMGIAAGDADGDRQLDLFVTNYYDESNALYRHLPGLLFRDAAAESGLRGPSLKQLGFGAQFLDADLDGWNDLVVTNGHVDDETENGIPLHMPTQFFHNTGGGQFMERPARELGSWFERPRLGRSLAILDWNRDGLEDFVVSDLESHAALLTNTSKRCGCFLSLQLVGTSSARDPIGTSVTVELSCGHHIMQQLTAGDGYQAANQRKLVFATGTDQHVEVVIQWTSGIRQTIHDLQTDQEWIVIEGRGQFRLPRS